MPLGLLGLDIPKGKCLDFLPTRLRSGDIIRKKRRSVAESQFAAADVALQPADPSSVNRFKALKRRRSSLVMGIAAGVIIDLFSITCIPRSYPMVGGCNCRI